MHSLISIVGVILNEKENYLEWSKKLKHTLIFNEFWVTIYDGDNPSIKPTNAKELMVWNHKNMKAYALIVASINEEVNCHINSIDDAWNALKNLK